MSKRDELIAKYADDLKNKIGVTPDMDLLTKVTIGCGPSIYNKDSSTVAGSDQSELETVKNNYLIKKLGLSDGPELDAAIAKGDRRENQTLSWEFPRHLALASWRAWAWRAAVVVAAVLLVRFPRLVLLCRRLDFLPYFRPSRRVTNLAAVFRFPLPPFVAVVAAVRVTVAVRVAVAPAVA